MGKKKRDGILQQKRGVLLVSLLLLFVLSVIVNYVIQLDKSYQFANEQTLVNAQVSKLRNHFESEINTTLNLTMGALLYVTAHPNITQAEFTNLAGEIRKRAPYIRNFALAPNNIISYVYPREGNEQVLGFNYMEHPGQREAVVRAIKDHKTVIAGPVKLVQGGEGFISRVPIFLDQAKTRYWGISSMVVMVDDLYKQVGLKTSERDLNIALRGTNAQGQNGEVFYGDPRLFQNPDNIISTIHLPEGSWMMAAAPKQGWNANTSRTYVVYVSGITIALLITALVYFLLMKNIHLRNEERKVIEAGEHKSRFFTQVTHELRTPMTAIHGAISLLSSANLPIEKTAPLIKNAERNSRRLIWLINDILDLKKLEAGILGYEKSAHELKPVLYEAVQEAMLYAEQAYIELLFEDHVESRIVVNIDNQRIQQVLINLLDNAIKFSPAGSQVRIDLKRHGNWARVEVADTGPGIPEPGIETIFDEFGLADEAIANRQHVGSSGLGLSVSRQLIEGHDGRIGCYNRREAGSVFYFELPLNG